MSDSGEPHGGSSPESHSSDIELSFGERAVSAAAAAFLSAIIVNPLDVAKVSQQMPRVM